MEQFFEFEPDQGEIAEVASPKFSSDSISKTHDVCSAFCISLTDQARRWRAKAFSQKLDSLLLNFVCGLTQMEDELTRDLDFRIWLYALDSDGLVVPPYRDYTRLWMGKRMSTFYLILTTNTKSAEIAECFGSFLEAKKVFLCDETHLADLPEGAFPLYRFSGGKVIEYVEKVCLDPALGKVPAYLCPIIQSGWLRYAWLAVDLDKCVRQALSAGKTVGRPMENIICNGSPTDYKVELRTWNWQSRWADAKVKISETIKVQSKSSKAA